MRNISASEISHVAEGMFSEVREIYKDKWPWHPGVCTELKQAPNHVQELWLRVAKINIESVDAVGEAIEKTLQEPTN
ncbi:hypothetical protein [Paenarthrobacter sp. JL.01a]|uniref:hypothetical protein n=1 Tax=Paenarthrobacter sp. JL.01a TaxID=2979324 RepID=UPI0021C6FCD9|nr:hypothetical protein [Paenarthrobacter sp. JL.01a]UXM90903.1 hypothetical protein N5P29_16630 [Paenarthrobacter sp. JL.01a]